MPENKAAGGGLFNRFFIFIWFINLMTAVAHASMNNVVAVYLSKIGLDSVYNGYLGIFFAVFAIAARFICGNMSDKVGRRALLVISAFLFGAGIFFFGATGSLVVLLIMRGVQGFGFATNAQTVSAATADVMPKSKVGLGIGAIWVVQSIATILASRLTSSTIAAGTFKTLFNIMSLVMAACTVLAVLCNYEKRPEYKIEKQEERPGERGLRKFVEVKAIPSAVMLIFICGSFTGVTHFLFRYAEAIDYKTPDFFYIVSAVAMLAANVVMAKYSDKVKPILLLAPAAIGGIICQVLLATATANAGVIMPIAGALYGISTGLAYPVLNQIAVKCSPDDRRGAASATFFLAMDVGIMIGTFVWGWIVDAISFSAGYTVAAVCMAISLLLCFLILREKKPQYKQA